MNETIVSILVPVYNVEAYLPKCIDTIIGQTYRNLQVVMIDDGSKDGSWKVMQEYAARDARIEIYHQENQGVASTRNHLLEKVRGEYVLFVDSDDWIEPEMVEYLLTNIQVEDADMVTCSNVINDESVVQDEVHREVWSQEKAVMEFLRHVSFNGSLWNKLVKASLLHNLRFHCGISYGEDALFCWGILQKVSKVIVTDRNLYHYRMNNNSLSHKSWTPDKKGSNHIVWETISGETKRYWPGYVDIALARYALEDTWALYYASLASYPYDKEIILRQNNVKKNFLLVKNAKLCSIKIVLLAIMLSWCYPAGRILIYTR